MPLSFHAADEIGMIVDTVSNFAAERLRPDLRRFEADQAVPAKVHAEFAELGLMALELPETAGGVGLGPQARVQLNRRLGAVDAGAALALDRLGPALYGLEALGPAAVAHYAARLSDPDVRLLLVVEDASFRVADGRVTGEAAWVPASRADLVVGLGPDGAWIAEGAILTPVRALGLRAAGASRLALDAPVLEMRSDPAAAARAFAKVRLYFGSLLLGVLYDLTEFSRAYAQERTAFGQPIAHHQGLAFLMMDMFSAVERARLLIEDAAARLEADAPEAPALCAAAFVEAVEASRFVGPNGVQVLGGHGFMQDFPMEKAMREARALGLLGGRGDAARDAAATLLSAGAPAFSI